MACPSLHSTWSGCLACSTPVTGTAAACHPSPSCLSASLAHAKTGVRAAAWHADKHLTLIAHDDQGTKITRDLTTHPHPAHENLTIEGKFQVLMPARTGPDGTFALGDSGGACRYDEFDDGGLSVRAWDPRFPTLLDWPKEGTSVSSSALHARGS